MTRRLIIRAEAEADITEAVLWYQKESSALADEFIAEVRAAIERAVQNPFAHLRLRRRPEVRRVLTARFPYRAFFVLRPDAIIVFRVLHGARHDREWKKSV
ncbi:MAG: type II toxin-antitoxin system RelE/ParE family toxin [Planctomycetes bacterium]|nr:type II toxin-antitoxin system RelE/ParE family toxin [Planctomycetota bacterium]